MDSSHFTPVPLTELDTELSQDRPGVPREPADPGDPPFLPVLAQNAAGRADAEAFGKGSPEDGRSSSPGTRPDRCQQGDGLYAPEGATREQFRRAGT